MIDLIGAALRHSRGRDWRCPGGTADSCSRRRSRQQPTFRSNVRLVNVNVIAHDSAGQPVKNLAAADFRDLRRRQGTEDRSLRGRGRSARADAAVRAAAVAAAPPNVFSNRLVEREAGGVTVILFDRLNSSFEDQKSARDQILKLLAKRQPGRPHRALRARVRRHHRAPRFHQRRRPADRRAQALPRQRPRSSCRDRKKRCRRSRRPAIAAEDADTEAWLARTHAAGGGDLPAAARRSRPPPRSRALPTTSPAFPGRKNLVWVSGSLSVRDSHRSRSADHEPGSQSRHARDQSADVAVYPVDIRGLIGAFVNPSTATATVQRGASAPRAPASSRRWRPRIRSRTRCATIAEATGGRVFFNTNAIGERDPQGHRRFARVVRARLLLVASRGRQPVPQHQRQGQSQRRRRFVIARATWRCAGAAARFEGAARRRSSA